MYYNHQGQHHCIKSLFVLLCCSLLLTGCTKKENTESSAEEVTVTPTPKPAKASHTVMNYDEYMAAPMNETVTIHAYVQAKEDLLEDEDGNDTVTLYLQDKDGGYYVYDMPILEMDYDHLKKGQEMYITGTKTQWEGEIEIIEASSYRIGNGSWISEPVDIDDIYMDEEALQTHMNQLVSLKDLTVTDIQLPDQEGGDINIICTKDDISIPLVIVSALYDEDSDEYTQAENLLQGDTVDVQGFLYWYNEKPQIHIKSFSVHETEKDVSTDVPQD